LAWEWCVQPWSRNSTHRIGKVVQKYQLTLCGTAWTLLRFWRERSY
jgi:hypothetical protein